MSNPYSSTTIISKGTLSQNKMWGGPFTQTQYTNTEYYWNNHSTINDANVGNPLQFTYTLNNSGNVYSTMYVYVMCDSYAQFYLNGNYIQTFSGLTDTTTPLKINVVQGSNTFSFICVYLGNTRTSYTTGMFACSVSSTIGGSPVFTTNYPSTSWSLSVLGYKVNNVGFTDLFAPNTDIFNTVPSVSDITVILTAGTQSTYTDNGTTNTICLSRSSQYGLASMYGTKIYIYSNYGTTGKYSSSISNANWTDTAISGSGKYGLACEYGVLGGAYGRLWYSNDYCNNWIAVVDSSKNWTSVALSDTGQYGLACGNGILWYSSDYGINWNVSNYVITNGISISCSGQYAIGINSKLLYYSNNYGVTWYAASNVPSVSWSDTAISCTGQYCLACIFNKSSNVPGEIYYSNNYGVTWSQTTSIAAFWNRISISASGQYGLASCGYGAATLNKLYYSSNYGVNWNIISSSSDAHYYYAVAISSSGQYGLAYMYYNRTVKPYYINLNFTNNAYMIDRYSMNYNVLDIYSKSSTVNNYNTSYTVSTPSTDIASFFNLYSRLSSTNYSLFQANTSITVSAISISSSGQYGIACVYGGKIYYSKNYGITWTASNSTTANFRNVSISSSGQYGIACDVSNGKIYYSSDYGVNWPASNSVNAAWLGISISSSGQYGLACVYSGQIYRSSDYGITWTVSTTLVKYWGSVSISSSGQYGIACVQSGGQIFYSNDYGASWNIATTFNKNWISVSISSSGQYGIACGNGEIIVYSSNYGVTWSNSNSNSADWSSISISSSGQYGLACNSTGIWYSIDYGVTWNLSKSITNGNGCISISSSGQYALFANYTGIIYYLKY